MEYSCLGTTTMAVLSSKHCGNQLILPKRIISQGADDAVFFSRYTSI